MSLLFTIFSSVSIFNLEQINAGLKIKQLPAIFLNQYISAKVLDIQTMGISPAHHSVFLRHSNCSSFGFHNVFRLDGLGISVYQVTLQCV